LIGYQWQTNSKIAEVIKNMPLLIRRSIKDSKEKILTSYGEYGLNEIYDINEFLINMEIHLFKCTVEHEGHPEERYIIVTDIYILIFIPVFHLKNYAKLIVMAELNEMHSLKIVKEMNEKDEQKTGIILEWESTKHFDDVIIMNSGHIHQFKDLIRRMVKRYNDSFIYFSEDLHKHSTPNIIKSNIKRLTDIIEYKEKCYLEDNNTELRSDLMLLYQRIIEVLSGGVGEEYMIYMIKLKKLLA
jgi:hypothetical protein